LATTLLLPEPEAVITELVWPQPTQMTRVLEPID
jgi:hypothetical protein